MYLTFLKVVKLQLRHKGHFTNNSIYIVLIKVFQSNDNKICTEEQ